MSGKRGTAGAAGCFAEHLRAPGRASAQRLSEALDDLGDCLEADLLRRFATGGEHCVAAEWWAPGAVCHLSLNLPTPIETGQLWFDPLEVSCALLVPWPYTRAAEQAQRPPFESWMNVRPVATWQLRGAHQVNPTLPTELHDVSGEQAGDYCELFGKTPPLDFTWLLLREAHGMGTLTRLWGSSIFEYGREAATSGLVELYSLEDLGQWTLGGQYRPAETSQLSHEGHAVRGCASIGHPGLWQGAGALERSWRP